MADFTQQFLSTIFTREPFFHVKKVGDQFITTGSPSQHLGHQVTGATARPAEGTFAQWHWDGRSLSARVDECGFYPLYYYATPTECAVSPSIPALLYLGASPELDYDALSTFFYVGWFAGQDTPFKAIRAFLPEGSLEWRDGKTRTTGNVPVGKASNLSRGEGVDGYIELFRTALRKRLPDSEDFSVLLTGGRDTRHQLYELCLAGRQPKVGYSIGEYIVASNEEMAAASAVAEATQIQHVIINQSQSQFALEIRNNLATNFCADEHSWLWPLADFLKGKVKILYDGLGGSIWDRGFQLTERRLDLCDRERYEELADDLLVKNDIALILSSRMSARCSRAAAIAKVADELRYHANSPNPIDSFLFWTRTRRESALSSFRVLDASHTVICPFIDRPLVDHLASLPGQMMLDHNFHDETIHRAFPQYAHIPFGPKGGPLNLSSQRARQLTWEFAKFLSATPRSECISYSYLLPRIGRCLLDSRYSPSILWMGLSSLYILQLEMLPRQIEQMKRANTGVSSHHTVGS